VRPERSTGKQRLYREADVVRLERLRRLTILGHSIGQVARLSDPELEALLNRDLRPSVGDVDPRNDTHLAPDALCTTCLRAVERMDALLLDATLRRAAISLGSVAFAERVVGPLVQQVGDLWHRGAIRVGQEHLVTTTVRSVLSWVCRASGAHNQARTILVATTAGQRHELGAMMAAAIASAAGWNAVYVGPDMPTAEIAEEARATDAAAVALSFIYPTTSADVEQHVREVRGLLEQRVTIFVGGAATEGLGPRLERLGATHVASLSQYRDALILAA
jgi:methanogenic corrinoid protein MtbC1